MESDDDLLVVMMLDEQKRNDADLDADFMFLSNMFSSDSDCSDNYCRGGSRPGRAPNVDRKRRFYSDLLFKDYWGPTPVYNAQHFRTRFRMPRELFDKIHRDLCEFDSYFVQKLDALRRPGLSPLQKICCSLRMLTSGVSAEEQDDKYRMGASTALESLKTFCSDIDLLYSKEALRNPTEEDLKALLHESNKQGWPGCLGSIDCMHWKWKNCPVAWHGQFKGKKKAPTVILEAIADSKCRFWHFFFGMPGACNDINVLDHSDLHNDAINGKAPVISYQVNGNEYQMGYWLADGIYPSHQCFIKTIPNPQGRKSSVFAQKQEAKRKDIERAFGILQARFHILTTPCRLWDRDAMKTVIKACVILHNLIIDFENQNNMNSEYINNTEHIPADPFQLEFPAGDYQPSYSEKVRNMKQIIHVGKHKQLQKDLMEHVWQLHGEEGN